ncbi:type II toxin-antitoxin system YhaV family toxin [Chamaesiphon sp. OTE_75_metabat_556]|uniref:type II toxin-antitoxin system YhaV family toxin n=1 Tax=Chamaesiphon sp. OTE_75_metabat_556 TaxID=2964692 RepID=UPI00286B5346|nr:type II toxin-antitoxin system YhaV family toxin [Chamaesiphon sp. OTE_75_metabat_556]
MKPFDANGWTILFYEDFQLQWADLTAKVVKLKSKLEPKDFVTHPDVKLLKAIDSGIRDKISLDPFASHFALRKPLDRYGRLKKMGLPQRYRLFFRAFAERRVIIILWLGFPRREGDRRDWYKVFSKMVANGKLPDSYESLVAQFELEDDEATADTELEEQIDCLDLFSASPTDEE